MCIKTIGKCREEEQEGRVEGGGRGRGEHNAQGPQTFQLN